MRHSSTLELGGCLGNTPIFLGKLTKVNVECFGNKWAGRNCTIAGRERFRLAVCFMQDNCVCGVQLRDGGKLNFIDDGIDKKLEVFDGCGATKEVMGGSNGVNV